MELRINRVRIKHFRPVQSFNMEVYENFFSVEFLVVRENY